jgi:probable phage associated protein
MEVQKIEVKDPSGLLLMMANLLVGAVSKPEQQEEAKEEPLPPVTVTEAKGINDFAIGKEVIIRTYSAGVWFGVLSQKAGNEVILTKARRMYQWRAKESISISGVARYGIKQENSKICGEVDSVWLEAIEIIPVAGNAAESLRSALEVAQS